MKKNVLIEKPLQVNNVRGNNYECGYETGKIFCRTIRSRIKCLGTGKHVPEKNILSFESDFPEYFAELDGIADGANVPLSTVFTLNLNDILRHSCSTVVDWKNGLPVVGHNEDWSSLTMKKTWGKIVQYNIKDRVFTAYTYAGELFGNGYGWNDKNIYFFVNSIESPIKIEVGMSKVTPIYVMLRRMYEYDHLDTVIRYLKETDIAGSVQITILQENKVYSIEKYYSQTLIKKVEVVYAHTNHLIHDGTLGLDRTNKNSVFRLSRIHELLKENKQMFEILHDSKNHPYAIYGTSKDEHTTLSSIIVS